MTGRDRAYAMLLQVGFIVLRVAVDSKDWDWVRAEIEWLHNVPSLIGETNLERHRYFWNAERVAYFQWMAANGSEQAQQKMRTYYEPVLREFPGLE